MDVVNHTPHPIDHEAVVGAVRAALRAFQVRRAALQVAVVDDLTIAEVHSRHLGDDSPTDVITFPLSEPGDDRLCGDLIISWDTAEREAVHRGLTTMGELVLYALHGTLHLVGLDDGSPAQAAEMRRWESCLMEELGWPPPWKDLPGGLEPTA